MLRRLVVELAVVVGCAVVGLAWGAWGERVKGWLRGTAEKGGRA